MSLLLHPHDIMRRYVLGHVDGGIGWDETYALIFTLTGRIVVRVTRDYTQDYKTPDVREIEDKEYPSIKIDGEPLLDVVIRKLREILPPSN